MSRTHRPAFLYLKRTRISPEYKYYERVFYGPLLFIKKDSNGNLDPNFLLALLPLGCGSSGIIGIAIMPVIITVNLNKIRLVSGFSGPGVV